MTAKDEIIGISVLSDVYDSRVIETFHQETKLYDLARSINPDNRRTMIKDVNEMLKEIQYDIDYEKDRCKYCGIHPDECGEW